MTQEMREALERRGRQWGEDNNLRLHEMREELPSARAHCNTRHPRNYNGLRGIGDGGYVAARDVTGSD